MKNLRTIWLLVAISSVLSASEKPTFSTIINRTNKTINMEFETPDSVFFAWTNGRPTLEGKYKVEIASGKTVEIPANVNGIRHPDSNEWLPHHHDNDIKKSYTIKNFKTSNNINYISFARDETTTTNQNSSEDNSTESEYENIATTHGTITNCAHCMIAIMFYKTTREFQHIHPILRAIFNTGLGKELKQEMANDYINIAPNETKSIPNDATFMRIPNVALYPIDSTSSYSILYYSEEERPYPIECFKFIDNKTENRIMSDFEKKYRKIELPTRSTKTTESSMHNDTPRFEIISETTHKTNITPTIKSLATNQPQNSLISKTPTTHSSEMSNID